MITLLLLMTSSFATETTGYRCKAMCLAQSCDRQVYLGKPITHSNNLSRADVFEQASILCETRAQKRGYQMGYLVKPHDGWSRYPVPANAKDDCVRDYSIPADQVPGYFTGDEDEPVGG